MTRPWITLTETIKVDRPFVLLTCRCFAWPMIRRVAEKSGVELEETRVGLITKRFTVYGTVHNLERFINFMCDEDPFLYDRLTA